MHVLDAFCGHLTEDVKTNVRKKRIEIVVIPGGMTSILQPLDVGINETFNDAIQDDYKWLQKDNLPKISSGKVRRASPITVANGVTTAWDKVSEKAIV